MSHKILIADDSLTIQKVIKITLANEPFDIAVCSSDAELEQSIIDEKPNIVLLDFNLSEDKTGYELSKEIHSLVSNVKILMLYGTFDTIDEDMLQEANVDHKIVKPFDGTKFINLCRSMSQSLSDTKISFVELTVDNDNEDDDSFEPVIEDEISDDWVMNSPQTISNTKIEKPQHKDTSPVSRPATSSILQKDLAEWGMEVPGVIGGTSVSSMDIPEVIKEASLSQDEVEALTDGAFASLTSNSSNAEMITQEQIDAMAGASFGKSTNLQQAQIDNIVENKNDPIIPDSSDLEYPDIEAMQKAAPTSELVSLDQLAPEDDYIIDIEDKTGEFVIENGSLGIGTSTEEEVRAIERQIEDEMEEDLWKADGEEIEEDSIPSELSSVTTGQEPMDDIPVVEPHKLYNVMKNSPELSQMLDQQAPSDFPEDVMKESSTHFEVTEDLKEKLKEQLTPIVQEFVKQYCRENIEKIAWEVIPDLAENLIKKEIQKISNSILNS